MMNSTVNEMMMVLLILVIFAHAVANIEPISHRAARYIVKGLQTAELDGSYGNKPSTARDMYTSIHQQSQIKIYRPELFKMLRSHAGFGESEYLNDLIEDQLECIASDSKSGAAFWRSQDGNIVMKTIKHYECKTIREILDDYSRHIVGREHSCIARLLGVYRVKLAQSGQKVYFMVCRNVYSAPTVALEAPSSNSVLSSGGAGSRAFSSQINNSTKLIRTTFNSYDLKGSTVGRWKSLTSKVLKDNDLRSSREVFHLGAKNKNLLLDTLLRDSAFMLRHNLMDYSLLVQVQHVVEVKRSVWQRIIDSVLRRRATGTSGDGVNTVNDRYATIVELQST